MKGSRVRGVEGEFFMDKSLTVFEKKSSRKFIVLNLSIYVIMICQITLGGKV